MRFSQLLVPLGVAAALVAVAPAALVPAKTVLRPAAISRIALTGKNVAFVVGGTHGDCDHSELWLETTRVVRLGKKTSQPCSEGPSTGSGVWDIALAKTRTLWITYAGGNLRDWQLWTATPTKRTPKQLRFAELDVDDPPPLHIGPGTTQGVPFAAGREVVFLGENGAAIFERTLAAPVQGIAAGRGPNGVRVAAVLASGPVVALTAGGTIAARFSFAPGAVRVARVTPGAVVVQVGEEVRFLPGGSGRVAVKLPARAELLDVAQGRILYAQNGDLRSRTIATGADVPLVEGTPKSPARGTLGPQGFAWSHGNKLTWRGGTLPRT